MLIDYGDMWLGWHVDTATGLTYLWSSTGETAVKKDDEWTILSEPTVWDELYAHIPGLDPIPWWPGKGLRC